MSPSSSRAASALALVLTLAAAGSLGCMVTYDDEFPGLADAPSPGDDDELVYERELSWPGSPSRQRVGLWLRDDGSYLLLRRRWQGTEVYGWSTATLTDDGQGRLGNALAVADPSMTAPTPGDLDCTSADALRAVLYVDGEDIEYLSLCPPQGLVELARVYADMVELMLSCPFDGSWYADPLPIDAGECDAIE